MEKNKKGFTLVELLVTMSIIGVLAAIGLGSFNTAQVRGRDAQRKSDLKQISHALELYYSDHGVYPSADLIRANVEFTDGKTVYFKKIPADPSPGRNYIYRQVPSDPNKKFQLFAKLENTEDKDLLTVGTDIIDISCGSSGSCNYSVTSANTSPTEE
jgi:general secretion pathway protein G